MAGLKDLETPQAFGASNFGATQSQTPSDQPPFAVAAPKMELPKGGGAIRGIGEKFAANPVTGTGTLSVPIAVSPSRNAFEPKLTLSYDSGAGNGPFGFGWSLSLPAITRKTDKGLPRYLDAEESDVYVLSGAEDLVPRMRDDAPYIPSMHVEASPCTPWRAASNLGLGDRGRRTWYLGPRFPYALLSTSN